MLLAQVETVLKEFSPYGPVWILVALLLLGFIAIAFGIYRGIGGAVQVLFDTDLRPDGKPRGLLIPFIEEHLGVFRRTEELVNAITLATTAMALDSEQDKKHAQQFKELLELLERRLEKLDMLEINKMKHSLSVVASMLLDLMESAKLPQTTIEHHREKLRNILRTRKI